jgi:asparagine synthase (glutamine-hydrolysing)
MATVIEHRGPDGGGVWAEPSDTVALAHRRLAIIDLSERGAQPMHSQDGRFVLVYNGEIYNHRELRSELERDYGYVFRSDSDTEVLLNAFQQWGTDCVRKCNGMFAFAIHDRQARRTYLVRDRLGVKPLYYARTSDGVVFASELRAILTVPDLSLEFAPQSVCQFVREGYVGGTQTILQTIKKVSAATIVTIASNGDWKEHRYWSAEEVYSAAELPMTEADALDSLEELLSDAFTKRIIADVPVGLYLSGGVDSTLLASILVRRGVKPHAFTLAVRGGNRDESLQARETARLLDIHHTVEELNVDDIKANISRLATVYDDPLGDPSALPTLAVSQAASRHVKVVLSADGGDELFGGYRRYAWAQRMEAALKIVPRCLVHAGARWMGEAAAGFSKSSKLGRSWTKLSDVAGRASAFERYREWNASCGSSDLRGLFPHVEPAAAGTEVAQALCGKPLLHQLMAMDVVSYLEGDILNKVDRATMAVSIEGREPFLDYRIVEWAARTRVHFRVAHGRGKILLKQLLARYGLPEVARRPKKGFSIPLVHWMTADWRDLVREHVHARAFKDVPGIDPSAVDALVRRFERGDVRVIPVLYVLLSFALWRQKWVG